MSEFIFCLQIGALFKPGAKFPSGFPQGGSLMSEHVFKHTLDMWHVRKGKSLFHMDELRQCYVPLGGYC